MTPDADRREQGVVRQEIAGIQGRLGPRLEAVPDPADDQRVGRPAQGAVGLQVPQELLPAIGVVEHASPQVFALNERFLAQFTPWLDRIDLWFWGTRVVQEERM